MKNIIVILFLLLNINLFSQENEQAKMFSTFKFGVLAGMNFSALSGGSLIMEGKTNLSSNLNLTLSFGYSAINKKEGYHVQTYQHIILPDYNFYETESYNVNEMNYDVFPVSLGLEYIIQHSVFSPYVLVEGGYNFFNYLQLTSNHITGEGGSAATLAQLPLAYQGALPAISKNDSYRIAIGAGTTYKLSKFINLDLRYVYQFNKSLESTNQILIGLNL
jgi:hypothetical protein